MRTLVTCLLLINTVIAGTEFQRPEVQLEHKRADVAFMAEFDFPDFELADFISYMKCGEKYSIEIGNELYDERYNEVNYHTYIWYYGESGRKKFYYRCP